ncbi:cytochrome c [Phyllobacterium sp. 21LDTY02-6]|jgi:cytochrome c556|uniref:c-type cytochrome n=1 Tax=Phyllobacterium sp. 21LDTY02-6 TaxID=2944903 RepID=UPI0020205941|nr:cytochrome c [Phyllobacterium sp. 21LDTY02-6]MCO4318380.1 cytochrome c [Phyllobacterium sp. 21LDTY02-6]
MQSSRLIALIPALALALSAASAATADPITERQALMKDQGRAVGTVTPIMKGEKPFDAAIVQSALKKLNDDAQKIDAATLFPAGTDKGDTTASPKIWEDNAGFVAAIEKYKADTAAAVAADPKDLESFKTAFSQVSKNCGTCHQTYRIKKD